MHTANSNAPDIGAITDALCQLAATIGAALNIVTASLYETSIWTQTNALNQQMMEIADNAQLGKVDDAKIIAIGEAVNQLNALLIKRKASNPLIADALIATINVATIEAEKVISLVQKMRRDQG
jgi:hypothetical protein